MKNRLIFILILIFSIFLLETKPLFSGDFIITQKTPSSLQKYPPQIVLDSTNNKLHYVWNELDGSKNQIWTAEMNTDGTGWSATKRTTSAYHKDFPQLVLDSTNNKLYYVWGENDGTYDQIWTAEMNIDGTGWSSTKRTTSNYYKHCPQLVLDSSNNKLYYVWQELDASFNYQIWTAEMNIDGTGWSETKQTTSAYSKENPELVLDSTNNKLYYVWQESDGAGKYQIWTAEMNTNQTGWLATKRTTSNYLKYVPHLILDSTNNKLYYVWHEKDGAGKNQIWTAEMNTNGTGWAATQRTTSAYDKLNPQLVLDSTNNKLHYVWQEYDVSFKWQIWTAEMNTDGSGWAATQRTTSASDKLNPQLVLDGSNGQIHYIWKDDSNKLFVAVYTLGPGLSISLSSSSYDFETVIKGSTTTSTSAITVTNDGSVNERYSLHLTAPIGWTCVTDTAPGVEEFRMCGNFQTATAQSSHFVIAVSSSDAIGTTQRVCTDADFARDNEGEAAKGYNIPQGQDRYLWFRFEAPTDTTLKTQQTITITVTAEEQP